MSDHKDDIFMSEEEQKFTTYSHIKKAAAAVAEEVVIPVTIPLDSKGPLVELNKDISEARKAFGKVLNNEYARLTDPEFDLTWYTESQRKMIRICIAWSLQLPGFDWLDYKKGLLFIGAKGIGKTQVMRAWLSTIVTMMPNEKISFVPYEDMYINTSILKDNALFKQALDAERVCIDDFARNEGRVNDFGNDFNLLAAIISRRNSRNLMTHGTTNITVEGLKEIFNEHTFSRMCGMFNMIIVDGEQKDHRRKDQPIKLSDIKL